MRVIQSGLGPIPCPGMSLMDAYFSEHDDSAIFNKSPILVVGSSERALSNAARAVEATGLRVAGREPIESARERIDRQVSASAVWIELDRDAGASGDELLKHVSRDVAEGR